MASKKSVNLVPLFIALAATVAVVFYIVRRNSDSSLASAAAWVGQQLEGFDTKASTGTNCPKNWKFFNNEKGTSFCCGAEVNPYGASCSDPAKLCAFEPNVADPRGGARGALPLCKPN
jgi:hypothetical protein